MKPQETDTPESDEIKNMRALAKFSAIIVIVSILAAIAIGTSNIADQPTREILAAGLCFNAILYAKVCESTLDEIEATK